MCLCTHLEGCKRASRLLFAFLLFNQLLRGCVWHASVCGLWTAQARREAFQLLLRGLDGEFLFRHGAQRCRRRVSPRTSWSTARKKSTLSRSPAPAAPRPAPRRWTGALLSTSTASPLFALRLGANAGRSRGTASGAANNVRSTPAHSCPGRPLRTRAQGECCDAPPCVPPSPPAGLTRTRFAAPTAVSASRGRLRAKVSSVAAPGVTPAGVAIAKMAAMVAS
jgi:hypothetical protein